MKKIIGLMLIIVVAAGCGSGGGGGGSSANAKPTPPSTHTLVFTLDSTEVAQACLTRAVVGSNPGGINLGVDVMLPFTATETKVPDGDVWAMYATAAPCGAPLTAPTSVQLHCKITVDGAVPQFDTVNNMYFGPEDTAYGFVDCASGSGVS